MKYTCVFFLPASSLLTNASHSFCHLSFFFFVLLHNSILLFLLAVSPAILLLHLLTNVLQILCCSSLHPPPFFVACPPHPPPHPPGLIISLQLLRGELEQIRRENQAVFNRALALTRKLGFPDVILPGEAAESSGRWWVGGGGTRDRSEDGEREIESRKWPCGQDLP